MPMEKKSLYQHIWNSTPVAMVTMDHEFKITSFNKHAEIMTGYVSNEAIGRLCHEILNCRCCENDCPLRTFQNASGPPSDLESEIVNRYGEHISIKIKAVTMLSENKKFVGYLVVIEDISRQKRREREKNNFISMIAHDMKSPLVGISGLITRLKKESICETNEKLRVYLTAMAEAEKRLESMVNDFLEYSHLVSGQINLELSETDVRKVLLQVVEIQKIRAEEKNIVLSLDCIPLTVIEADANRLHRVFTNIIDNAIKYSPEQTEVSIRAREVEDDIVISFQDQGWGIEPEEIPYIFDAFYRTESIKKTCGQGLGLAASRAVIGQHGGRISVKSISGKGSVFTVQLPKKKPKIIDTP